MNKMNKKIKIILIVVTILVSVICVLIYLKLTKQIDGFNPGQTNNPSSTSPSPNQVQILPAIGPCGSVTLSSDDMQFAGLLILNQFGNNIFNNYYVKTNLSDITGTVTLIPKTSPSSTSPSSTSPTSTRSPTSTSPTSTSPTSTSPTLSTIQNAFKQTYDIILNGDICEFYNNTSNPIISINPVPSNTNTSINQFVCEKKTININTTQTFSAPNKNTTLTINIPKFANQLANNSISGIIIFLNNNVNNANMLNTLKVSINDLNDKPISNWNNPIPIIAEDKYISLLLPLSTTIPSSTMSSTSTTIPSSTMSSTSTTIPSSTMSSTSTTKAATSTTNAATSTTNAATSTTNAATSTTNAATSTTRNSSTGTVVAFANINMIEKFSQVYANYVSPINYIPVPAPIPSIIPTTTQYVNNITPTTTPMNNFGYKILPNPNTNLYQTDFAGTSNVYSPYIYYNQ